MLSKFYLCIALIILLSIQILPQKKLTHQFSNSLNFGLSAGATLSKTDYDAMIDYIGAASLEYFFPAYSPATFGLRANVSYGFLSGEKAWRVPAKFKTDINSYGLNILFGYNFVDVILPYIGGGLEYVKFNPKDNKGNLMPRNAAGDYTKNELNGVLEFGLKIPVSSNMHLSLSAQGYLSPNDNLDDIKTANDIDMYIAVKGGINYTFLKDYDSDKDGIEDDEDKCPNTPLGILVNQFGCPNDADDDGVPDYKDKCSNTPANVRVDENGCPLDSDNDGVADNKDLCPNTEINVKVDNSGCPLDKDKDGVPDSKDICENTLAGVEVDQNGCPKDDDKDGVPNYLDKCPDTKSGEKVDKLTGCSKSEVETSQMPKMNETIIISGANFASGKAELLSQSFNQLDRLYAIINSLPDSRWRIEGYTDNRGKDAANLKLSVLRAEAVVKFFTTRGIKRDRFDVAGLGKANPIDDNNTESGRAKNRRVELTRIK